MSSAFWVELLLALMGLAGSIFLVLKFKRNLLQRKRARRLRSILVPLVQAVLPELAAQLYTHEMDDNPFQKNGEKITRFCSHLDRWLKESTVLFPEEYATLSQFSSDLALILPSFQAGGPSRLATEELILLGQRVVHEMTENGY